MNNRNVQFTPDAFLEFATEAIQQVYEEAGSLELHDLRTWRKKLTTAMGSLDAYRGDEFSSESGEGGE